MLSRNLVKFNIVQSVADLDDGHLDVECMTKYTWSSSPKNTPPSSLHPLPPPQDPATEPNSLG